MPSSGLSRCLAIHLPMTGGRESLMHSSASRACVLAVYKLRSCLCIASQLTHSLAGSHGFGVDNTTQKATAFTQATTFLYTVYEQSFYSFVSVVEQFVHIIHIAYIKNYFSRKVGY